MGFHCLQAAYATPLLIHLDRRAKYLPLPAYGMCEDWRYSFTVTGRGDVPLCYALEYDKG